MVVPQPRGATPSLTSLFSSSSSSSSSLSAVTILKEDIDMDSSGSLPGGDLELPFKFTVRPRSGEALVETYHGVYVSVTYGITAQLKKPPSAFSMLSSSAPIEHQVEFTVHVPTAPAPGAEPDPGRVDIHLVPESLQNVREGSRASLPKFEIRGTLNQTKRCSLGAPFTGFIDVVHSDARIRSIDLQLVRVETVRTPEGEHTEPTEIQDLQIGEGDVPRGLPIPIFMIFPRLFTCPSARSPAFDVQFEVNLIITFEDHYQVAESYKLELVR
jgi:hypothetical protein